MTGSSRNRHRAGRAPAGAGRPARLAAHHWFAVVLEVGAMPGRELWSYVEIGLHINVQTETVRNYKRHGLLPAPDLVDPAGHPRWYPETIRAWALARPGRR